jgi:hypothetical protein
MRRKLLLSGLISVLMFVSMAVGAYGATNLETISAYLNKELSIKLDGKTWAAKDDEGNALYPITYNGSTYLPVRAVGEAVGKKVGWDETTQTILLGESVNESGYEVTITFPSDKYPETAAHIRAAIAKGKSTICTIDRGGADSNRSKSLAGVPTKAGYDRDEWPMAMCAEGGAGADIAYVTPADNRGAGSWIGNELTGYPDGVRVLIVVPEGKAASVAPSTPAPTSTAPVYSSCQQVKDAGKAPIRKGDPGYSAKLDRDGDGIACE